MATLSELLFELVDVKPAHSSIVSNESHKSIEQKMVEVFDDPYSLICGKPKEGGLYLVCDEPFVFLPDLLFERSVMDKDTIMEERLYGYLLGKDDGC